MQLRKKGLKKIQVCGIHTLRSQCRCGALAKANLNVNRYYCMAPTLVVSEATIAILDVCHSKPSLLKLLNKEHVYTHVNTISIS